MMMAEGLPIALGHGVELGVGVDGTANERSNEKMNKNYACVRARRKNERLNAL